MDHKGMGWEGMDCIHLFQDRGKWQAVVNIFLNLCSASNVGYVLISSRLMSLPRAVLYGVTEIFRH
jgi:hypothetical protein